MSEKPGSRSWKDVHPDFDGHLEWPLERMTPGQRLAWLDAIVAFRAQCVLSDKGDEHRSDPLSASRRG